MVKKKKRGAKGLFALTRHIPISTSTQQGHCLRIKKIGLSYK